MAEQLCLGTENSGVDGRPGLKWGPGEYCFLYGVPGLLNSRLSDVIDINNQTDQGVLDDADITMRSSQQAVEMSEISCNQS